jgi:hypothetical protein
MVSRRSFLGGLAVALALDPERLLWLPGKKVISVPAPRVRTLRHLAVDVPLSPYQPCCIREPFGEREFRAIVETTRGQLESDIKIFCEREMVRPRFQNLEMPVDGIPYTERFTDHVSGFKSRAMVAYDLNRPQKILRVDALFEA